MRQVFQIFGSLCILVPFALSQFGYMKPSSKIYITLNLIGSTILAVQGGQAKEWGFLLLEGAWAFVSLIALVRTVRALRFNNRSKQQVSSAK